MPSPPLWNGPERTERVCDVAGVDLEPLLALIDVRFAQEKATGLDIARNRAATARSHVHVDAVVLATGLVASPFTAAVPGDNDELGRLIVDATMRVAGVSNVFVSSLVVSGVVNEARWPTAHAGRTGGICFVRRCWLRACLLLTSAGRTAVVRHELIDERSVFGDDDGRTVGIWHGAIGHAHLGAHRGEHFWTTRCR